MNPSALPAARTESEPATEEPPEPPGTHRPAPALPDRSIYNRVFWLAYIANVSLVMANALTFRFAEFVSTFLKGTEETAGMIVSVGILGALLVRLVLGQAIDNYGTRRLWILGCAVYIVSSSSFLVISELGWPIYAARLGFAAGIATMFTCSMVHIQNQVPANRRTEVIGNLGSSGFVGMILGSQLGDFIFRVTSEGHPRFLVRSTVLPMNRGWDFCRVTPGMRTAWVAPRAL
jgi:MFS family permease